MTDQIRIEYMAVDDLLNRFDPENPKDHDLGALSISMETFGYVEPVVINEATGLLLAGHGRVEEVARRLGAGEAPPERIEVNDDGMWLMPVIRGIRIENEDDARAYLVASNRITELGGWKDDDLLAILKDLAPEKLVATGFDLEDLERLREDLEGPLHDPYGDAENPDPEPLESISTEDWRAKLGTVWRIESLTSPGKYHRMFVWDATDSSAMALFWGTERADLVWTDPPYGVSYVGRTADKLTIQNDDSADIADLLNKSFEGAHAMMLDGAPIYVAHPCALSVTFGKAFLDAGFHLHQILVWVKDSMVLGHSDYHYQHEPILYGWRKGVERRWYGGRDKKSTFFVDRPKASREHPTMKPVDLVRECIRNSSHVRALVFDPFLGSGSTLLAAERESRLCYGIELSPAYAEVILRRAEALGMKVELERTLVNE